MARSNHNVTSAKPGSCPMNKKLRNAVLDELITTHEQNPNKRLGDIARIVEASQEEYPYVTRDSFNNRWRALKKQRKEAAAVTNSTENSAGSSEDSSVLANAAEGDLNSEGKAGRKKGSTDAAKLERTQQEMEALHWVTMKCKESKDRNPKKMKSGTIDHLITSARSKFKLPPMWNPSKETIRTRLKKKIHVVNPKRGRKSPVPEAVERTVVEIACESNRPTDIIDWQIHFCPTIRKRFKETKERPTSANLGPGWYQGFRQRNPEIATAKAINHDERRASWCKYGNMSDMFGMIYKRLKEAGHAKELPTPQWQDLHGNVVSEKEAYGHRVEYYLTHPDRILMFDEMGSNTNTTKDKNSGNSKFHVRKGERCRNTAFNGDCHFTGLGVTTATGKPVMCVTIIQKETDLSTAEYLGHNEGAHWVGDKNDIKGNTGPDKFFCGGPTVNFNGIDIPPLVVHSSSGGITPEILTLVEDRLDELNVFPRGNGKPDPVILVDAHGSRLSAKFLNYVFNKAHRWIVLFGLPNGTGFWQVGDSNAQNGNMKAHLVKAKREVLQMRMAKGQRAAISRKDVVPLVTSGWDKSFGHIENNKRACAKTQSRMPCAPRDPPDEG